MMAIAISESSPLVGSSRNRHVGDVISSTPMDARFFSPPETPGIPDTRDPMYVLAALAKPYINNLQRW